VLNELGVTRRCIGDIEIAITEACANVVEHTVGDDEYELSVSVTSEVCEMRVVDTGRGFDYEAVAERTPDLHGERGRGIGLIKALIDRVEFESVPEKGMIVHLVKQLELEASRSRPVGT
jgi:serine/threonine-protein kinase RsbW